MGNHPLGKTISTFDPKLLQIDSTSEISVFKNDERRKKLSAPTINIHQIEHIPRNDPKLFINFICSKFDTLKELSLDDELNDGNPIEIKKIDINKKVFPKKSNHIKFSKNKNSDKYLSVEKIKKTIHKISEHYTCQNVLKGNFDKIDDLKEKPTSGKNITSFLHRRSLKSPKKAKFHHHKKHYKFKKNKEYKNNPSLSTIKSVKSDCEDEQINTKDSLDVIRSILNEMGD